MKKLLKGTAIVLGVVVGLVVLLAAGVYVVSQQRINRTYDLPAYALTVSADSAAVARGAHIATIRGCFDCHGEDFGGRVFIDDPALGRIVGANLTAAARTFTPADWDRTIRHGVGTDGRPLLVMPSYEYQTLSDADLAALAAYFKQLPPVERELPENRVGPLGRVLFLAGKLPLVPAEMVDHAGKTPSTVVPAVNVEYGAYLATSCTGCHGANLGGGPIPGMPPGTPPAANLTPTALGSWTEADFFRALREGRRPDGTEINEVMPWRGATSKMTDDEIRALWLYLQTVPPVDVAI